jgi:hypothetical protein
MNLPPHDIEALGRLHRAGWSIGDVAFHDGAGGLTWLVWGSNGENLIRAEGASRDEAVGMGGDHLPVRAWETSRQIAVSDTHNRP